MAVRGARKPSARSSPTLRSRAPKAPPVSDMASRVGKPPSSCGGVHLGVVQTVPTVTSVDVTDIDGSKHRIAPDQLLSLWPVEFGVLPRYTPVRAQPRDARRLRLLWDRVKTNEASLATADIAHSIFGTLSPESFALTADLLSRQRSFFKRGAPLTGWVPVSQSASLHAQRSGFREEAEQIIAKKQSSFIAPEHAEALDDLALYYLSSIYGGKSAYITRQQSAAGLLQSLGRSRTPEAAAQFLVDIGYWSPHHPPSLQSLPSGSTNSAAVRTFTPEQLEASALLHSQPLSVKDPSMAFRKDLTRRQAFWPRKDHRATGVAFGYDVREDGSSWLLVHIPDIYRWLPADSALRQCAQQQLVSFSPSAYRLPLLPSLAESALSFQPNRFNSAITVAFNDNVSERKSEIFLSKISPVVEVSADVLDALKAPTYSPRLRTYGIGQRTFTSLRKVTAGIAPPSTAHESFWTAVSSLTVRAVTELRSFLTSMNAPLDPSTAFSSDTYLNILAHEQLHALLSGKPPHVSHDLLQSVKKATDARTAALTSEYHSLSAAAPELLLAQAQRQQRLLGLADGATVELLGIVLRSGAKGSTVMVHPVNQLARLPATSEDFFSGAFVRADFQSATQTIDKVTKL